MGIDVYIVEVAEPQQYRRGLVVKTSNVKTILKLEFSDIENL